MGSKQALDRFIKSAPKIDRKRLLDRVKFAKQIHNLQDRKWWLTLQYSPPEVRARIYWSRFRAANKADRIRLEKTMKKFPGIRSARFAKELSRLKRGGLVD